MINNLINKLVFKNRGTNSNSVKKGKKSKVTESSNTRQVYQELSKYGCNHQLLNNQREPLSLQQKMTTKRKTCFRIHLKYFKKFQNYLTMKKFTLIFVLFLASFTLIAQTTTFGVGAGTQGGSSASYFGYQAGPQSTGVHNSFLGFRSGFSNTTGRYNIFVGSHSGYKNTTGAHNTFIGLESGRNNTTGHTNAFLGSRSGKNNINGFRNTYIGYATGHNNTTGQYNTYLGSEAGYSAKGSRNVFVGYQAGKNQTSASDKLCIDNSSTNLPLIYGDFATDQLTVNGGLSVADPSGDNALTLTATNNGAWNNKIRFNDKNYGVRHLITDSYTTNMLTINPGSGGDAKDIVHINGRMLVGHPSTNTPAGYNLYVHTGILSGKVKVATVNSADWADYVFAEDYDLNSTEKVEEFIKANKHLPNVPSAKEVSENGVDMVEMDATLLRQIEELWLHVIELKKEIAELEAK